jgi:hypothetical protein
MYLGQLVPINLIAHRKFHQLTRSEVKQEQLQSKELNISDLAISLSPVGFVFSWVLFFLILRKIRIYLDNKMVFSVKGLHKLPCKNCRFYSKNHYLKCAVQPSIVLTEEAMNCSEYSPNKGKFFPKDFFK